MTWTFDTATNTLAMASGTYSYIVKVGATAADDAHHDRRLDQLPAMLPVPPGPVPKVSSVASSVPHICGNYNFGGNFTNDSTYNQSTPDAISATVTLGGDDYVLGAPQTLVNSYSNFTAARLSRVRRPASSVMSSTTARIWCSVLAMPQPALMPVISIPLISLSAAAADAVDDGPVDVLEATATPIYRWRK